jgi:hypothetical protein
MDRVAHSRIRILSVVAPHQLALVIQRCGRIAPALLDHCQLRWCEWLRVTWLPLSASALRRAFVWQWLRQSRRGRFWSAAVVGTSVTDEGQSRTNHERAHGSWDHRSRQIEGKGMRREWKKMHERCMQSREKSTDEGISGAHKSSSSDSSSSSLESRLNGFVATCCTGTLAA